jgi:hypothetical protein
MRTTLDLSDELLRRAKIAAVTEGVTLKDLITRALANELDNPSRVPNRRRAKFPIFESSSPGSLNLTEDDVRLIELAEDLRRSG